MTSNETSDEKDAATMSGKKSDDTYTEKQTQRRFDKALKLALNTPPKPHKIAPARKAKKTAAEKTKRQPS